VPSVFPRLRPAAPGPGRGAAGPIPGPAHSPGRSRSPPAETAPALAGIPLPRQVLRQQRLEGLRRVLRKVETAALVCDDAAVFQWVARWLSLCWVSCSPASRQKPVHRLPSVWPRSSGRTIDFRVRRLRRPEHVPLPVDRVDQANGVAVVHLLTELPDAGRRSCSNNSRRPARPAPGHTRARAPVPRCGRAPPGAYTPAA
jgi:hypothetical protein